VFEIDHVSKRFGDVQAVDDVSFATRPGEIYGLLGPNGAGKTTTFSMLTGLLAPDTGRVLFEGVDLAADPVGVKRQLGVVPQETALYEDLTARENLRFWGGFYGLGGAALSAAVERALERVGLGARAKDPVRTYSGGMKRRLNLALGLVHEPRAVLLDEPTVGIDPQARLHILEVVRELAAAGAAVIYTTHYLEEAESLCQRIGILDRGRLLAEGTLEELRRQAGEEDLVIVRGSFAAEAARAHARELPGARLVSAEDGKLVLAAGGDGSGTVAVLARLLEGELPVDGVTLQPPSLNSLFLNLTGRELRD
jgi:ABC-2 type transport system ATP-binding protein